MGDKPAILYINAPFPAVLETLNELFTVYNYREATDKAALVAAAAPHVRAVFSNGSAWIPSMLDALPKLEIVACTSTGYDEFDIEAFRKRGVRLTHSPGLTATDVSDLGMGLMLATARRMMWADRYVRSGEWLAKGRPPMTRRVAGKKIGIVGLGAIGLAIAKKAAGFDMEISYQGPRPKAGVPYRYYASVVEMARDVDYLMLACIGGPTTAGIVNAEVLKALGPDGILVNIARGSCVDQPALLAALRANTIGGAGLDVYEHEPHEPEPFAGLDNVALSPHCASGTPDTRRSMCELGVENLLAHFAGRPLLSPVRELPNP